MRVAVFTVPSYERGCRGSAVAARVYRHARQSLYASVGRFVGRIPVSGPGQVERSLVRGLEVLGMETDHNPWRIPPLIDLAFVPIGLDALRQVLAFKADGRIKVVVAGPNLCMFPNELKLESAASLPDFYVLPSEWSRQRWLKFDQKFPVPVITAFAGVDAVAWTRDKTTAGTRRALIYNKYNDEALARECAGVLAQCGYASDCLRYGAFQPREYRQRLQQADVMIYLSRSESQGIALFEAWSMNVPTFVLKRGLGEHGAVPAPYLSPTTGAFFDTLADLESKLNALRSMEQKFSPRQWIDEFGSDEQATRALLDKVLTPSPARDFSAGSIPR